MQSVVTGQYVRSHISPSETRRAIVAVVNERERTADLMFLASYGGGSESPDEVLSDIEVNNVPFSNLFPLLSWELVPVRSLSNADMIKELGNELFKMRDWVGAVSLYREGLCRLRNGATDQKVFLLREDSVVKVVRETGSGMEFVATVDPSKGGGSNVLMHVSPPPSVCERPLSLSSFYQVGYPPAMHATLLLNLGRSLLQRHTFEEAIGEFSNGIFVACLDAHCDGLIGKLYFWRAKARILLGRGSAALRDAAAAMTFCDVQLRGECEQLLREAKIVENQNNASLKNIRREILSLCGALGQIQ